MSDVEDLKFLLSLYLYNIFPTDLEHQPGPVSPLYVDQQELVLHPPAEFLKRSTQAISW